MCGDFRTGVVVLGVLLLAGGRTEAQPLIHTLESLESLVINADRLRVARIVAVRDDQIPGGSPLPRITIEVEQTLKHPLFEERHDKIGVFVHPPTAHFKDYQSRSARLLIAHSDYSRNEPKLVELTEGKTEVFRSDFTLLRDPDEVVRAAREILDRAPANVRTLHTARVSIPSEALVDTNYGSLTQLIVPVDKQLEERAVRRLGSESYSDRYEAARVLRWFKSAANIDRLRAVLDDPGHAQLTGDGQAFERYYGVRDHAYQALRAWGVEVERPMIRDTEPPSAAAP